jgi:hypothetical protein
MQYVSGGVEAIMPRRVLFTQLMGFTEEQAGAIEEQLKRHPPPPPPAAGGKPNGSQSGNRLGNPLAGDNGRPRGNLPNYTPPRPVSRPGPPCSCASRGATEWTT